MPRLSGQTPEISLEELVATLKRSRLPTVVVEGVNDILVYSCLEYLYQAELLSVISAGSRSNVLKIFEIRDQIRNIPCLSFIVDRDLWVFTGVPSQYQHPSLVLTEGYSVENDIFLDGELLRLMSLSEKNDFLAEYELLLYWYSIVVSRLLDGKFGELDIHSGRIVAGPEKDEFRRLHPGERFPSDLHEAIQSDNFRSIRGKNLLDLVLRQLSSSKRGVKHTRLSLFEHVRARPGQRLQAAIDHIGSICGYAGVSR